MGKSAKTLIVEAFSVPRPHAEQIDCLRRAYPEGLRAPNIGLVDGEKVFGVYRNKYYLTCHRLIIQAEKRMISVAYNKICRVRMLPKEGDEYHHIIVLQDGAEIEVKAPDSFLNIVVYILEQLKPRVPLARVKIVGPPHLQPYAVKLGPRLRRLYQFETGAGEWHRAIRCDCGESSSLGIRYLGERHDCGTIADSETERQRIELSCDSCSKRIVLFDAWCHGYDAVICRGSAKAPKPRGAVKKYACCCGGKSFAVAVRAEYSLEREELAALAPEEWDHTFTWFHSVIQCDKCGAVATLVDYECA